MEKTKVEVLPIFLFIFIAPFCAEGKDNDNIPFAASVVPNQHIVILKSRTDGEQENTMHTVQSSLTTAYGFQIKQAYRIGNFRALLIQGTSVQVSDVKSTLDARLNFHEFGVDSNDPLEDIDAIHPNIILRNNVDSKQTCIRQDTGLSLWGLSRIAMRDSGSYLGNEYSYSTDDDGTGVTVYVMDTGIYTEHDDFDGRAIWGYTAPDTLEGDYDLNGHGTHVSGTIGGRTYGVAKNVKLVAVKMLNRNGTGPVSALLDGMEWAMDDYNKLGRPPTVWSMSIGADSTYDYGGAFAEAKLNGITVVVAAGNEETNACYSTPAFLPETITVGSSGGSDDFSSFSNYGPCVDIIAPGEVIKSAYIGSPTATALSSGTSMSTPFVAGAIARYISSLDYIPTPDQVRNWLISTSTKDVVVFSDEFIEQSTVNRLLYVECKGQVIDPGSASTPAACLMPWGWCESDTAHHYYSVCVLLVGFIISIIAK